MSHKLTRRNFAKGAVAAAAIITTAGLSRPARAAIKIRHAGAGNAQYHGNKVMQQFWDEIAKRTNGEIVAETFWGTLGGEKTLIDGVGLGTLDSSQTAYTGLREFDLFYTAYMFRDYDHASKAISGPLEPKLKALLEKKYNAHLLGLGRAGPFALEVKEKISSWSGINNKKIRAGQIEGVLASLKAFGANAVPIPFNEVYSALQQGVVDGQVTLSTLQVSQKYYEVVKYVVRNDFGLGFDKVVISNRIWNRLTPAQQKLMTDTFNEMEPTVWYKPVRQQLEEDFKKWEAANGAGSVIALDDKEGARIMAPVAEKLTDDVFGPGTWKAIQQD